MKGYQDYPCEFCKYYSTCGDWEREQDCEGFSLTSYEEYMKWRKEDEQKTKNFYKDLVGSCKGTRYRWEICTDEMAELMGIPLKVAEIWERKIIRYGISERQNGGIVTNA